MSTTEGLTANLLAEVELALGHPPSAESVEWAERNVPAPDRFYPILAFEAGREMERQRPCEWEWDTESAAWVPACTDVAHRHGEQDEGRLFEVSAFCCYCGGYISTAQDRG